jgi:hypothetical protein
VDIGRAASGEPPGEVGGTSFDPRRRRRSIESWSAIAVSRSDQHYFSIGITALPEDIDYEVIEQDRWKFRKVSGVAQIGRMDPELAGP